MKKVLGALFLLSLATAASSEVRMFGEHGGYDIGGIPSTRDEAGSCVAYEDDFEGPGLTKLSLLWRVNKPDIIFVSVSNYNWSVKENERYEVEYLIADGVYERTAIGSKDGYRKGFVGGFPTTAFLDDFAKSTYFHITHKDGTVIDKLSLSGSAAAVAVLRQCQAYVRRTERAAQAERDRFKDIPRDPFAKPVPEQNKAPTNLDDPNEEMTRAQNGDDRSDPRFRNLFGTVKQMDGTAQSKPK